MLNKDLNYLQEKQIGGVISKALAETYIQQP